MEFFAGQGAALRFGGDRWSRVATGTSETLVSVWGSGPDDVIGVGDSGLIRHRKGGTWQIEDVEESNGFSAVWGSGPADVFAVGENGVVFHDQVAA